MNRRSDWVDYAKAIGILLVVYGHVARGLHSAGISMPENTYTLIDSVLYSFHMPLFFFLSGLFFLKSYEKKGARDLALSKIDTLVYPFLLWSLVQGSIEVFLSQYTNGHTSWAEVFSSPWKPRAQFWFLHTLFLIFLIAIAAHWFSKRTSILGMLLISLMLYLWPAAHIQQVVTAISKNLPFFVLGIVYSLLGKNIKLDSPKVAIVLFSLFLISQYSFHALHGLTYVDTGLGSLSLAVISIGFIASASMFADRIGIPALKYLGESSMVIYLLHILMASGTRVFLKTICGIQSPFVHIVGGVAVGVMGPLVILSALQRYRIKYVFSAPVSELFARRTSPRNSA